MKRDTDLEGIVRRLWEVDSWSPAVDSEYLTAAEKEAEILTAASLQYTDQQFEVTSAFLLAKRPVHVTLRLPLTSLQKVSCNAISGSKDQNVELRKLYQYAPALHGREDYIHSQTQSQRIYYSLLSPVQNV